MRLDFGISQGKGTTHVHLRYENNFNDHIINDYLHFIENKEEERRIQEHGYGPEYHFVRLGLIRPEMETLLHDIYSVQKVSPSDKNAWNKAIDEKLPFLRPQGWDFDTIEFQKELWNTSVLIERLLENPNSKYFYYDDLDEKHGESKGLFFIPPKL